MSMLELITKASATHEQLPSDSQYPIVLNPDPILLNLKPQSHESNDASFGKRVEGWKLSQTDIEFTELGRNFSKMLEIKLKDLKSFTKVEFISMLNSYLKKYTDKLGISVVVEEKDEGFTKALVISVAVEPEGEGYTKALIQKIGFLMGETVVGLVLEGCFAFEIWEVLKTLIVGGLIEGSCSRKLVHNLIEKRRSDLVCLCLKHVSDLQFSDILSVLKFFLSPPKDAYDTMAFIRKEWETEALSAIEMAKGKTLATKISNLAKDAAILLMMAHDEFTTSELCLHYLLSSPNLDDAIFSACIGNLNGSEIMGFVRYLKKWLKKYQKFPQASSSAIPKASLRWLKVCYSIPSLENVTKCFGFVLDERFSSLVMHPEFCEEVKSIELVVNSLASEARICCKLANLSKLMIEGLNHN